MAAIVRVKRRRDEDPADCLLLSCKKIKADNGEQSADHGDSEDTKSVFKFATTLPQKETNVTKHVREAIRKEKLMKEYKKHTAYRDPTERGRIQHKALSDKGRLTVISQRRALELDALNDTAGETPEADTAAANKETSRLFCLYDVEDADKAESSSKQNTTAVSQKPTGEEEVITCNNVPMVREKVAPPAGKKSKQEGDYVYDIYYMNDAKFDFRSLENILAIEAAREELVLLDDRASEDEEVYDDDDDENAESNWRNDYPDEESNYVERVRRFSDDEDYDAEGFDYNEDQMAAMIEKHLQLNELDFKGCGEELSSGEEDHAYFDEPLKLGSKPAGPTRSYEAYKAQMMKEMGMEDDT